MKLSKIQKTFYLSGEANEKLLTIANTHGLSQTVIMQLALNQFIKKKLNL